MTHMKFLPVIFLIVALLIATVQAQDPRAISGRVVTSQFEAVPGAIVEITTVNGTTELVTDTNGRFRSNVSGRVISIKVSGRNIVSVSRSVADDESLAGIQLKIEHIVPPISETVTIQADALTPQIEYRNGAIYENSLFGRDDQLIQTLNAGINAGQHEGGGKSLEIRRYGFNLDHGGVGGGLKVLVDNVQQNAGTQGHGQGYLGSLKSTSPELVEDVSIINGPFSAAYGDFSGLGVVQIRQRETLPQTFMARVQAGSFNTFRGFYAVSPNWNNIDSFIAYEPTYTDGPFTNKLRYRRDNVTGNLTYRIGARQSLGFRANFGRNDFISSGQIPLDLVADGELDRFGFIDPDNGGKVRNGTAAIYYRHEAGSGATLKADAFVSRTLFDLFSNFTFFLADPVYGDEIQQHDSRLQEGANVQFINPYKLFGSTSVVTAGANVHLNQINVGLYPSISRDPRRKSLAVNTDNANVLLTRARADVDNYAGYVQNDLTLFDGRLHVDLGLRFDYFSFRVDGLEISDAVIDVRGSEGEGRLQPKASIALVPVKNLPVTVYANYGRGISSQDARGVIRSPSAPKLATTDFYQFGASYSGDRLSAVVSSFLIDRSNEQVYIPDDGSIELAGPTRSYGVEFRNSFRITNRVSFNGGLTKVIRAFYRDELGADGSRRIVDSAPHLIANAGLVFADFYGFNSSISWRHISSYRLDPDDPSIRASGNDVVDIAISRRLTRWLDANLAVDNLLNKRYFETQNYFESRVCPTCDVRARIHATPGYPLTVTLGATIRFGRKN